MNTGIDNQLKLELGENFQTNVVLRDFTSMKVGGVCDYFFRAKNIEELIKAVSVAIKLGVPYFILGGGFNIIFSDIGFPGLVIKNESHDLHFLPSKGEVIADSGVNLANLINESASRDLGGLEFLFGVPGTIGGAVYNNAGAFGQSITNLLKFVTILIPNKKNGDYKIVRYRADWLIGSYRQSRLKDLATKTTLEEPRPVLLTIKLQLTQSKREVILNRMRSNLKWRRDHQPLLDMSSGSFFKNPGETREQSAGFLLDQVGAKKIHIGKASVSKKHANFVINRGGAKADEIKRLAEQLKIKVRDSYRITLEEEVEYVGRW